MKKYRFGFEPWGLLRPALLWYYMSFTGPPVIVPLTLPPCLAFAFFTIDRRNFVSVLASAVYGYGCPGYTREEAARVFGRADYKVTSLRGSPCRERILRSVDICRFTPKACPETLGMVHYFNIPLNGEMSDLTGIFYLRKLSETSMTLEFHDLHVM